jgi:starvation-inducible DNA-binding protein
MKQNAKALDTTRIDVKADACLQACEILQQALADVADLTMQTKTAHWNVKGPHFIALHKLFDELYEDVSVHVDTIAERMAALGGHVKGRVQDVVESTRLKPYPLEISEGLEHVKALADAYGQFANELRADIGTLEDLNDEVSSDVLNALTADLDKKLWFLEAHLRK